jgi:hypothetical protein
MSESVALWDGIEIVLSRIAKGALRLGIPSTAMNVPG